MYRPVLIGYAGIQTLFISQSEKYSKLIWYWRWSYRTVPVFTWLGNE